METPLYYALIVQIDEFKSQAATMAAAQYDHAITRLVGANWDLNVIAPFPKGTDANYKEMKMMRAWLESLTTRANPQPSYKPCDPNIRIASDSAKMRLIDNAVKEAELNYLDYITKLENKIGVTVKTAMLDGNLWSGSILTVATTEGTQRWNTKIIINQSKYGKLFNQFPSRKLK